jgi:S1-C subfamily serine protease
MEEGASQSGSARQAGKKGTVASVVWIVALTGLALLATWASRSCAGGHRASTTFKNSIQALATNPAEFVKNRITGGVGALLGLDSATGLAKVMEIMNGSPADTAGLRAGDLISQVNGATMTGQKLDSVVEAIRGFSLGSVTITVLRGETNRTRLEFVIRRHSMNALLQPTNSYH